MYCRYRPLICWIGLWTEMNSWLVHVAMKAMNQKGAVKITKVMGAADHQPAARRALEARCLW